MSARLPRDPLWWADGNDRPPGMPPQRTKLLVCLTEGGIFYRFSIVETKDTVEGWLAGSASRNNQVQMLPPHYQPLWVHAVAFPDGRVFDAVNGFREAQGSFRNWGEYPPLRGREWRGQLEGPPPPKPLSMGDISQSVEGPKRKPPMSKEEQRNKADSYFFGPHREVSQEARNNQLEARQALLDGQRLAQQAALGSQASAPRLAGRTARDITLQHMRAMERAMLWTPRINQQVAPQPRPGDMTIMNSDGTHRIIGNARPEGTPGRLVRDHSPIHGHWTPGELSERIWESEHPIRAKFAKTRKKFKIWKASDGGAYFRAVVVGATGLVAGITTALTILLNK